MSRRRAVVVSVSTLALVGAALAAAFAGSQSSSRQAGARALAPAGVANAAAPSLPAGASARSTEPVVGTGSFDGVSPAVRDLPQLPPPPAGLIRPREVENLARGARVPATDSVVQTAVGDAPMPAPLQNFEGICLGGFGTCGAGSSCSCLPPDTNGEVGKTQYVQMVNSSFAVYSKTGTLLSAPKNINQIWAGAGGRCQSTNDGDPIVLYDQLADRWLLSQFIASSPYGQCIAVSTTGDATGTYYRYTFIFGTTFHDYPKMSVWPDAYYMTTNEFPPNATLSEGVGAFAFERDMMLQGAVPRYVFYDEGAPGGQYTFVASHLPLDVDGSAMPPAGTPGLFAAVDDPVTLPPPWPAGWNLRIWKFDVDWSTNPPTSTLGVGANHDANFVVPVAQFVRPQCVYGHPPASCVPQRNGPEGLDVLGDRIMFRAAYRNYGTHESLVLNHSVEVLDPTAPNGTRIGLRWYEIRNPGGTGGPPVIHQQGTYAPADTPTNLLWRWMGSIAMDHSGDIALGFSASGPNDFPSIRYVGRLAGDPLHTLPQTEQTFPAPYGGPQTQVQGRWGDYSDLTVDPVDDCTFWYTQEYLEAADVVLGSWRTRIGAFKFPSCLGPTAVDVKTFTARTTKGGVQLSWRTGTETEILGFNVFRSSGKTWRKLNRSLVPAKHSGRSIGAAYRFVDRKAASRGLNTYRLQVVDLKGKRSWYGVGSAPAR